ncbi:dihydrodipicolinate synthase family protein [Arenicella xantha]|uniref:4-hydroxy-tetrahydrodipicolinate synthase n=1 Tax=Arenicella xantha TaxID=644221 RepID=A0A395JQD3_9GAMM|nr:dihydrodipicolinate synthase family protein [Arenicella xantha]RBP53573.1 4-hydroxy-tetrahydrodipicolinate synthase [Arenicella xantha]
MDRDSIDWGGYIPALTTPFFEDESLDEEGVKTLHAWVHSKGVHGFIVLGTQGEWFNQTTAEKRRVMEIAGEHMHGKLTLIAGCNAFRAPEALENIRCAADNGFDGILLTPPPYMMPTEREIYEFYKEVNAGSALPICIYNWPPGTNVDMSLNLLSKLADLDKVVAIKNSTPNPTHFVNVLAAVKDRVRVFGAPMNDMGISLVTKHGCDGTMGAGAVLGSDQPNFYNAIWAGDLDRAREYGARDIRIMSDWFNADYTGRFGSAQAIFKEALNQQGLPGGIPRRPILPLEEQDVAAIRKTLLDLGVISS